MNINHFKELLRKEEAILLESMSMIGVMNTQIDSDWVVKSEITSEHEPNMMADIEEEKETNQGILDTLEERMLQVRNALLRIENDTYGICKISGNKIEEKRLEADPAAETCLEHVNDKEE